MGLDILPKFLVVRSPIIAAVSKQADKPQAVVVCVSPKFLFLRPLQNPHRQRTRSIARPPLPPQPYKPQDRMHLQRPRTQGLVPSSSLSVWSLALDDPNRPALRNIPAWIEGKKQKVKCRVKRQ